MTKKRILFTTEFTSLNTGYSSYYRNLMSELNKDPSLQIAELACVTDPKALIDMANGSQCPISMVKNGDKVITHLGNSKKVLNTFIKQYDGEVYKLHRKFLNYSSLELTEGHLVLTIKKENAYEKGKINKKLKINPDYEWVAVNNLKRGDFVAYPNDIENVVIDKINCNGLSLDLDDDLAFLFGWYLAEGCVPHFTKIGQTLVDITLSLNENHIAENLERIVREKFNLKTRIIKTENTYNLQITSRYLARILTILFGASSRDKFINNAFWQAPKDFILKMISSYFEGDGYSKQEDNFLLLSTVSKQLSLDVNRLLLKHGVRCSCKNRCGICYLLMVMGEDAKPISQYFTFKNKDFTNLARRETIWKDNILFCKLSHVDKSQYCGLVYNLHVEEDNSYVCNGFAIHNCYCHPQQHAQQIAQTPWPVYSVLPTNPEEEQVYNSHPTNEFGQWKFEQTCLDFFPHVICSIKDAWMDQYIDQSPFRRCYKTVFMPTVDADYQNSEWLDFYKRSDHILTYTGWSKNVLDKEGGGQINTVGVGDYAVNPDVFRFIPNKVEHKQNMGIRPDTFIVGMVARNQKRKLYPELANAFVDFVKKIDNEETKDVFLYFHTSFPDLGWNIPDLILNNGLSHKVLLTYTCMQCRHSFPSFYKDVRTVCPKCRSGNAVLSNSQQGCTETDLVNIYNMFDLYVQYSSNEGFGLSQVEAASCGVPVAGTNYTAMEEIIPKLNGYLVDPDKYFTEVETGRIMCYPNNAMLVDIIIKLWRLPEGVRNAKRAETRALAVKHYGSWKRVADNWRVALDKVQPDDTLWQAPPNIMNIPPQMPQECNQMSEEQFVNFLFINCLNEPRLVNSYIGLKTYRDLIWGRTNINNLGLMSNDMSLLGGRPQYRGFGKAEAYEYIKQYRNNINQWEDLRWRKIQSLQVK